MTHDKMREALDQGWQAYCKAPTNRDMGRSKVEAAIIAALDWQAARAGGEVEAVGHVFPDDIEKLKTTECSVTCYSVEMISPDGKTTPVYLRPPTPAAKVPKLTDAEINQITLDTLRSWPSFDAQVWACHVVKAVIFHLNKSTQPPEQAVPEWVTNAWRSVADDAYEYINSGSLIESERQESIANIEAINSWLSAAPQPASKILGLRPELLICDDHYVASADPTPEGGE